MAVSISAFSPATRSVLTCCFSIMMTMRDLRESFASIRALTALITTGTYSYREFSQARSMDIACGVHVMMSKECGSIRPRFFLTLTAVLLSFRDLIAGKLQAGAATTLEQR